MARNFFRHHPGRTYPEIPQKCPVSEGSHDSTVAFDEFLIIFVSRDFFNVIWMVWNEIKAEKCFQVPIFSGKSLLFSTDTLDQSLRQETFPFKGTQPVGTSRTVINL